MARQRLGLRLLAAAFPARPESGSQQPQSKTLAREAAPRALAFSPTTSACTVDGW
jgi:hypothetical protein